METVREPPRPYDESANVVPAVEMGRGNRPGPTAGTLLSCPASARAAQCRTRMLFEINRIVESRFSPLRASPAPPARFVAFEGILKFYQHTI